MPKKKKTYEALVRLVSAKTHKATLPGETIELTPGAAEDLLKRNRIKEVEDGADNRRDKLGKQPDIPK